MATSLVTSLLLPNYDEQTIVASVIGADATATTYLLNCPPGTDSNDCGTYNQSLTLGPWASATPVDGQPTTGAFDLYMTAEYEDPFEYSLHCEMTRTVPSECTVINNGGNNDGTPTVTLGQGSEELSAVALGYFPVTITAGLDLLQPGGGGGADPTGSSSESETQTQTTGSQTSPADDKDNAAAQAGARLMGVLAGVLMASMAVALF